MCDSALKSDQLANGRCGQVLGFPAPELSLLSTSTARGLARESEHLPKLLDMCIFVFNVRVWQPDMGCDRNHQQAVQQAAIFHLFKVT